MADVFLINDTMEHHEYVPKKYIQCMEINKVLFLFLIINEQNSHIKIIKSHQSTRSQFNKKKKLFNL